MTSRDVSPSRTRRAVLSSGLASLVGLSGCAGLPSRDRPSPTDAPATASPEPTPTTAERTLAVGETDDSGPGPAVTVAEVQVETHVTYLANPETVAVASDPESQFVFTDVKLHGEDSFDLWGPRLLVEEEAYRPTDRFGGVPGNALTGPEFLTGDAYDETEGGGIVGFEVPAPVSAGRVAVAYEREATPVRWLLDRATRDRLVDPPSFSVVDVDAPERVERGERATVGVTVGNDGGSRGRFRATVRGERQGIGARLVEGAVAPGETETLAVDVSVPPSPEFNPEYEDATSVTFVVDWGADSASATVAVAE